MYSYKESVVLVIESLKIPNKHRLHLRVKTYNCSVAE